MSERMETIRQRATVALAAMATASTATRATRCCDGDVSCACDHRWSTEAVRLATEALRTIEALASSAPRRRRTWASTPPFVAGSDTSEEAAFLIGPKAATLRADVLRHLDYCGQYGATDEEVQVALQMAGNTVRPRRIELETAGLVVRTATTRVTQAGRRAHVYVITARGLAWMQRLAESA
jgi:hypothetical protein